MHTFSDHEWFKSVVFSTWPCEIVLEIPFNLSIDDCGRLLWDVVLFWKGFESSDEEFESLLDPDNTFLCLTLFEGIVWGLVDLSCSRLNLLTQRSLGDLLGQIKFSFTQFRDEFSNSDPLELLTTLALVSFSIMFARAYRRERAPSFLSEDGSIVWPSLHALQPKELILQTSESPSSALKIFSLCAPFINALTSLESPSWMGVLGYSSSSSSSMRTALIF